MNCLTGRMRVVSRVNLVETLKDECGCIVTYDGTEAWIQCTVMLDRLEAWVDWWELSVEDEDSMTSTRTYIQWEAGNWRWACLCLGTCDMKYLFYAIGRLQPSTTQDEFLIIQQTLCERMWEETVFLSIVGWSQSGTWWYATGVCKALGTSGGARVPTTKLDQSRPNPHIFSQWEPVKYLGKRAAGNQPIKD